MINIEKIVIRQAQMTLKAPFKSGVDTVVDKPFLIVEVHQQNNIGYGEGLAFEKPYYTEETISTMHSVIEEVLIPLVLHTPLEQPDEVNALFAPIRRNAMAKAALETAIWDLYAQLMHKPLAQLIGGTQQAINVGVAIGLQPTTAQLITRIQTALNEGYSRIKVKIKPGEDIQLLATIRHHFPHIELMADANSAYTLDDIEHLKRLDQYKLLMIEQPLAHDDIVEHAELQRHIQTPICLDESICSLADAKRAIQIGSCKIINLKLARVGGFTEAKRIHDYCMERGVGVWCGGMLEAGIGRAHAIALASLPNFIFAADIAAAARYWHQDIVTPMISSQQGKIVVSTTSGRGYTADKNYIEQITTGKKTYR